MSSIGTGLPVLYEYDLSVTTFSPDGRVFQIEYATKAIDNSGYRPASSNPSDSLGDVDSEVPIRVSGSVVPEMELKGFSIGFNPRTVVGIKCKDGIVLGVEKLIASKMLLEGSNRRIHSVNRHSGMAIAGLAADGRQIVTRARAEAGNYLGFYGEEIPTKELCDRVAYYVHLCTLYWWLRPYGASAILGGYDRDGPQLYMIEPSGVAYVMSLLCHRRRIYKAGAWRYFGAAVGKGRQAAKTEIEKLKLSEMTCREGVIAVAKIIYNVHDEAKDKAFELEMSWICEESNREHQRVPADLLAEAKASAKAALEEDMDAD